MTKSPAGSELLFLREFKDAIMYFNMLERNMAYCLRWATVFAGAERGLLKFLSYPYDIKLKKTKSLINKRGRTKEYAAFLDMAEECRVLRNKLVHGHWEFVARNEKPIRFQVSAPFEEEGYLSQDEFSAQVAKLGKTNSLFIRLQKQHPIAHA